MPYVRLLILLVAAAGLLTACGGSPAATPTGPTSPTSQPVGEQPTEAPAEADQTDAPDAAEPTPGTALSACELVAPGDVEAALDLDAGTVDAGELELDPSVLDPAANECRYEGDWGGLIVASTPTDGVNVYDALVSAYGDEAEALEIGDGALWFEDNDRGYFLKGAVMVRLQFTHVVEGGLDSFRDPTIAIGEAAVAKV